MFETRGSLLSQQPSSLESSDFNSFMIAPTDIRKPEGLPAYLNPSRVLPNSGFNEFGNPFLPEKGLAKEGIGSLNNPMLFSPPPLYTPNQAPSKNISWVAAVGEKPWAYEAPCPEKRKFLVFDHSGNETRLMFSSLCAGGQNVPVKPTMCPVWNIEGGFTKQFDAHDFLHGRQAQKDEQVYIKTPIIYEESGENEILDEESEMHEDTEEINALLYSDDDDDDDDNDGYDEDVDEVSSGRSPLVNERVCNKQDNDDVALSSIPLKRLKTLDGHYKPALMDTMATCKQSLVSEKINSSDFISAIDEGTSPTVGSKRPRKDKICDTLKVLESILPGVKNKDPVSVLDEAIRYLKCMRYNAESMSMEDSDCSGCYEPLH